MFILGFYFDFFVYCFDVCWWFRIVKVGSFNFGIIIGFCLFIDQYFFIFEFKRILMIKFEKFLNVVIIVGVFGIG